MYFDQYVLFDKEHHINDDNQLKTKAMVRNPADVLVYLIETKEDSKRILFFFSKRIWNIDGIEYSEIDMRKALAHPDVISLYGASLVDSLRDPDIFDTLPDEDKRVILQYGRA